MKAVPGVRYLLPGPTRTARALVGRASETGLLFQGAMVSIMILIPANALSISPCTRLNLRVQNLCSSWSSDVSPSSPSIELELSRAMEHLIRSTSVSICGGRFEMCSSTNLLISAPTSESTGSDFSAAAEDVGAFISFSCIDLVYLIPNSNDISSRVNNCLGFFFNKQLFRRLR